MDITKNPIAAGSDCFKSSVPMASVPNLSDVLVLGFKAANV